MAAQSYSVPKIFVSHSSKDKAFCDRLVKDLRQHLHDKDAVWYDADRLDEGKSWPGDINAQIIACPIFIVILSKDAVESNWVKHEISVAWEQRSKSGKRIFPIKYKEKENESYKVRIDVATLQFFDFQPGHYKKALDDLLTKCLTPPEVPSLPLRRELLVRAISTIPLALLPGLLSASSLLRQTSSFPGTLLFPETASNNIDTGLPPPPSTFPSNPLLYRADWSKGLDGWAAPHSSNGPPICTPGKDHQAWLFCDDNIVSDLSSNCIFAPYKPPSNYAVEAEIQVVGILQGTACAFGVLVRWTQNLPAGYILGIGGLATLETPFFQEQSLQPQPAGGQFKPGQRWHRYRVEAKNDTFTLYVDNAKIFTQVDSTFKASGQVGLGCSGCSLNIRNFEVFGL